MILTHNGLLLTRKMRSKVIWDRAWTLEDQLCMSKKTNSIISKRNFTA